MNTSAELRAYGLNVSPQLRLFATRDRDALRIALYQVAAETRHLADVAPAGSVVASWRSLHVGVIDDVQVYGDHRQGRIIARGAEFTLPAGEAQAFAAALGLNYAPLPEA